MESVSSAGFFKLNFYYDRCGSHSEKKKEIINRRTSSFSICFSGHYERVSRLAAGTRIIQSPQLLLKCILCALKGHSV